MNEDKVQARKRKWNLVLLGIIAVICVALFMIWWDLRGQAKECLASPIQYWLKRAREYTGDEYVCTISGGNTVPVIISETNVTPLVTGGIRGNRTVSNFTYNFSLPN